MANLPNNMRTRKKETENNKLIANFMGYIYYHPQIRLEDQWDCLFYTELFSKVPILTFGDDEESSELIRIPNPDYKKLPHEKPRWNTELEDLSWASVYAGDYIYNLKYDISFNELMPVLEKIEKEFDCLTLTMRFCDGGEKISYIIDKAFESGLYLTNIGGQKVREYGSREINAQGTTRLESIYGAVIQFINLYNDYKNRK